MFLSVACWGSSAILTFGTGGSFFEEIWGWRGLDKFLTSELSGFVVLWGCCRREVHTMAPFLHTVSSLIGGTALFFLHSLSLSIAWLKLPAGGVHTRGREFGGGEGMDRLELCDTRGVI